MRFLISLLILGSLTNAQEVTGSILGNVQDPAGSGVAGAIVRVRSLERGSVVRTLTTDSEGAYVATLLPIGFYAVEVEAKGFKRFVQSNIELHVAEKLTLNPRMEIGDVAQTVTVEDYAPQVQLQNAASEGLVSGQEVRELSLNNRNYIQLLTLMPGVTSTATTDELYIGLQNPNGGTNVIPFSLNGGRTSGNAYMVDGADNLDRGSNLTLLTFPSVDAIAEFKAFRGSYSAEFGRGASGQINVITRSGGNRFHGNAYWFNRNDAYAANNYFNNLRNIARPPLRWNNWGYTFNGPIVKNKTFFFWSHEWRRVLTFNTFNALLPSAALKRGEFAQPVCVSFQGNTCLETSQRITNINPIARAYLNDIFNKLPDGDPNNFNVFTPIRSRFNARQELLKIDHRFSERFNVNVRWINDTIPTEEPGGLFTGSPVPLVPQTRTNAPGRSVTARFTHTISPRFYNEGGYAWSYGGISSEPIGLIRSDSSPNIRVPNMPFAVTLGRVPTLAVSGFSSLTGYGPYNNFNINQNYFDNFTAILNKHTLKLGVTVNAYRKQENHLTGLNAGSFSFLTTPRPTGTSIANQAWAYFLLGNVATFQQASTDLTPDLRQTQWEWYAQDDWRVRSNLTLNLGVRFSYFPSVTDRNSLLTNFNPAAYRADRAPQINPANGNIVPNTGDPLNGIIINGQNSPYGDRVVSSPGVKWAPRFGFAWDPFKDQKTAIRGGYGISYDSVLVGIYQQVVGQNPPFVNNITINNTRLENPQAGVVSISAAPRTLRFVPEPFRIPYTQNWSLDVQRQLRRFVVMVGYYGSKSTHLLGLQDMNSVPLGAAAAAGLLNENGHVTSTNLPRLNAIRPFRGYQYVNGVATDYNSNYHSLQVGAQRYFTSASSMRIAYTWSKALTDSPTDRSTAPQNLYCRACEYSRATFDRTHVLTISYFHRLPALKARGALVRYALGGWQASGISTFNTGLPQRITSALGVDWAGLGTVGASVAPIRPDRVADPHANAPRDRFAWFNTAAFQAVPNGETRVGNASATSVVGPGIHIWNISMFKNFTFREGVNAQLRIESFNTFNHTNWGSIGTGLGNTNFGQVISTRDPRRLQFGLKIGF
jgi:hypothetical protein